MQEKHKVTLYLPPELHHQLKIRSAVDLEPMSTLAERAIVFYLTHSDVVDEVEDVHGQVNRLYRCPECASSLVLQQGDLVSIGHQPGLLLDDADRSDQCDEGELVPC